jgi:hypothetical protein
MPNHLPRDNDDEPIPVLRLKPGGAHTIAAAGVSARNAVPFDPQTRVVSVYATGAVRLVFGDGAVVATAGGHYYPGGVYYDFAIGGTKDGVQYSHLAVLAVGADCSVYVSEKE